MMKEQILLVAFLCIVFMGINSSHIYLNLTDESCNYSLVLNVYSQNVTVNLTDLNNDGNTTTIDASGLVDLEYSVHLTNETNLSLCGYPANGSG